MRADEGILARWHKDTNASLVAGGTANAITVAANQTLSAYLDGLEIAFNVAANNTGATTLNVDAVGVKKVFKNFNSELVSGDFVTGQKVIVIFDSDGDSGAGAWQVVTPTAVDVTGKQDDVITTQGDLVLGDGGGNAARLAIGTNGQRLQSDGTTASWATPAAATPAASQAEQEAGSSTTVFTSPGRQQFHPSAAKVWVDYDQSGVPAVDASYNVTSVTDGGTGVWTIVIANDFGDANYIVSTTLRGTSIARGFTACGVAETAPRTTADCDMVSRSLSSDLTAAIANDLTDTNLVVMFGDLA